MSRYLVTIDGHSFEVDLAWLSDGASEIIVRQGDQTRTVVIPGVELPPDQMEWVIIDGRPYELVFDEDLRWVKGQGGIHRIEISDRDQAVTRPKSGSGRVKAPIPGLIVRVVVEVDQHVELGQPIAVLEAMKMENEIRAPCAGTVSKIHVQPGKGVLKGELVAEITP